MTATIYKFPDRFNFKGYRIPLYTDEEVYLTILAMNAFGGQDILVTEDNLESFDPVIVIKALAEAKISHIFSSKIRQIYSHILKSIETL